eukprot:GHVU01057057.1.p2 GENE.GHVU01057057.1~~GHVU01057057.1.p2  ORF type:complete len:108 (-),score=3.49 GHVU01057057.1:106-429(-)
MNTYGTYTHTHTAYTWHTHSRTAATATRCAQVTQKRHRLFLQPLVEWPTRPTTERLTNRVSSSHINAGLFPKATKKKLRASDSSLAVSPNCFTPPLVHSFIQPRRSQ